jgi:ribulose-5-phosphate 4-epimerase/fuculose-1-phosphate aldolase
MDKVERAKRDLVVANRILATEGVLDAYGHVSVRHPMDPGRYFLSRSLSPELVTLEDIIEFAIDGTAIGDERSPYLERFIHGALYEARPEATVVIHAHSESVLPFSITKTPLRAVAGWAGEMGAAAPVWDIADRFGDATNMMVTNMEIGRDLSRALATNNLVLMRGHGFTSTGASIVKAIHMAVHLPRNARVLLEALRLGEVKPLSPGEIGAFARLDGDSPAYRRGWNYWATKAGCAELLED